MGKRVTHSKFKTLAIAVACSAMGLSACWAEEPKKDEKAAAPAAAADNAVAHGARKTEAGGSFAAIVTLDDGSRSQEGAKLDEALGKWALPDGSPTYHVQKDGKMDWYAYSGFRRYHSECHVCHGPEGEGSTYAPGLVESMKTMDYSTFLGVVASGRERDAGGTKYIMPALGDNKNVMCYIEDLYVYLKGRSDGVIPRGRPAGRADITEGRKKADKDCGA
jgi:methanol metabolism-related c-type cytochrome